MKNIFLILMATVLIAGCSSSSSASLSSDEKVALTKINNSNSAMSTGN